MTLGFKHAQHFWRKQSLRGFLFGAARELALVFEMLTGSGVRSPKFRGDYL
jgi:hypothetical protein